MGHQAARVGVGEGGRAGANVEVHGVRGRIDAAVRAAVPDLHQGARVGHAHRIPQQQRVRDAEHGGRGADADRQRQRGGDREARRTAKQTRRVLQIAHRIVHPRERPGVAMRLPGPLPPQLHSRGAVRFGWRQAAALVVVLEQSQVRRQLTLQIGVSLVLAELGDHPSDEPADFHALIAPFFHWPSEWRLASSRSPHWHVKWNGPGADQAEQLERAGCGGILVESSGARE